MQLGTERAYIYSNSNIIHHFRIVCMYLYIRGHGGVLLGLS